MLAYFACSLHASVLSSSSRSIPFTSDISGFSRALPPWETTPVPIHGHPLWKPPVANDALLHVPVQEKSRALSKNTCTQYASLRDAVFFGSTAHFCMYVHRYGVYTTYYAHIKYTDEALVCRRPRRLLTYRPKTMLYW